MTPSKTVAVTEAYAIDYTELRTIARESGGWLRSSGGPAGDTAEVWHEDTKYVFSGPGLIAFLYAVKDNQNEGLYALKDLIEYIERSAKQAPSVFVRDAIIAQAKKTRAAAGMPEAPDA